MAAPIYLLTDSVGRFSGKISYSKIRNDQQCLIFRGPHRIDVSTGCIKTAASVMMILIKNVHKDLLDINILRRNTCYMLGRVSPVSVGSQPRILC